MSRHLYQICSAILFTLTVSVPAYAANVVHSRLREGAIICPVNPVTGAQEIYLPPVFTTIIEINVLQEAFTYLQFSPLKIGDDGQVIERAQFQERVFTTGPSYTIGQIILLPAITAVRDESNVLRAMHNGQIIDEVANIRKISEAQAKLPSEAEISARILESKRQKLEQQHKFNSILYTNFEPVIPETISYSDITIGDDEIFKIIQTPPKLEKRTERRIDSFFRQQARKNQYPVPKCKGYKIDGNDPEYKEVVPEYKYETELKDYMIFVTSPNYLFFNFTGERLKSDALIEAGYDSMIIQFAKKSDEIEIVGR